MKSTLARRAASALIALWLVPAPLVAQQRPPAARKPPDESRLAQAALAAAQEAIQRQDYALCASLLENFLFDHPGHLEALFNLAYCYAQAGRTADAVDLYRQTLELNPKCYPCRMSLGLLLLNAHQPGPAAEELQQAVELKPDDATAHALLADALTQLGKKPEALEHYRRAADLDPKNPAPRQTLLEFLLAQGDLAGAEAALEDLRALTPGDTSLLRLRAELRLRQNKPEEALAAYEEYLKANPADAVAHLEAGRLCRQLGKLEDALQHFEAADRLPATPDRSKTEAAAGLEGRADLLVELKRYDQAVALYQRALTAEPENASLHAALGYVYLAVRQYEPAAQEFETVLRLDPKRVESYNHLASALYLDGNLPGVIAALDRRAAYAEETPATFFLRAISYDKLNQCAPAIKYYQQFLAVNSSTNSDQYFEATGRLRLLKKRCPTARR